MNLCIFVIGEAQSGKGTFGELLARGMDCEAHDTSAVIIKACKKLTGEFYRRDMKEELRPTLIALGDIMCSKNPARLVELILQKDLDENHKCGTKKEWPTAPTYEQSPAIIINGIRRLEEFDAAKMEAGLRGFTCVTIKIERSLRFEDLSVKQDLKPKTDNYELQDARCDYLVENTATLEELAQQAEELAADLQSRI